jgi:Na+-driven multidrug efflux pump
MAVLLPCFGAVGRSSVVGRRPLVRRRRDALARSRPNLAARASSALPPFPLPGTPTAAWEGAAARSMAAFMLPTAAMPLADPLLSLVDTAAVGRCCPTASLAALAPNIQVFTFWSYLLSGLNAAALREVSARLAEGDGDGADRLASASLALAGGVGLVAGGITLAAGRALLAATGVADPSLVTAGLGYLRARAAGTPLVLTAAVCQALLLARGDTASPLAWAGVQVAANVAGDALLVWWAGAGLTGAALATVAAQALGTAGLLRAVCAGGAGRGVPTWAGLRQTFRPFDLATGGVGGASAATGGGGGASAASPASTLFRTVAPITAVYALKMAAYWTIQGAAACLPTTLLAAHMPVFAAWNLAAFALTPLEAAALRFCVKEPGTDRRRAAALARVVLFRCGGVLGLAGGLLAAFSAACCGGLFSPSPALWPLMRGLAPQAGLATLACAADVAATGVLVASGRPRTVVASMAGALAAVVAFRVLVISTAPVGPARLGLVWWALVLFFVVRAAGSVGGLWVGGLLGGRGSGACV